MITELRTFKGFPNFLTFKNNELTLVNPKPYVVGDGFTFGQTTGVDRKSTIVNRVIEILEERPAKGVVPNLIFQKFKTEVSIEDTSCETTLQSN